MRRRLLRFTINATTILSLVLCAGTGVLWLVVHYRPINFYSKINVGPVIVREDHIWANPRQVEGFFRCNADTTKPFSYIDFNVIPGVYLHWSLSNGRFFEFHFDYWLLLVIGSATRVARLAAALRRAARRHRAARARGHLCQSCGYDLRATPQRCPECGAAVAQAVRQ
jgi:hypothetical protein